MTTSHKSKRLFPFNYISVQAMALMTMILFFNFQLNNQRVSTVGALPEYKEGRDEMYKMIQKNILYPQAAMEENIQGTIFISFTVNKNGKIKEIKAEKVQHNLLEKVVVVGYHDNDLDKINGDDLSVLQEEGERIVALLGDFHPAEKDGSSVSLRMTLPIQFKLQ